LLCSSGNDLTQDFGGGPAEGHRILANMIEAYIKFPKLLISIINGPAIGIAGTTAALCDVVYMHENAYIYTPFGHLGLCAEGCSSFTFPAILGTSKATEMLTLNHKMSAKEAHEFKFVSEVYSDEKVIWEKLKSIEMLPLGTIIANKKLMRRFTTQQLLEANRSEIAELALRFESEEALTALLNFQASKQKGKL